MRRAKSAVGLDIGTFAVRAAEVRIRQGRPVLTRFGQVALQHGVVRGGEVVDPGAVGWAVRRLWAEAGFRARKVVLGIANGQVVVRTADMPAMPDDDLRSALAFEAPELIPLPVEESELDFEVLDEGVGYDGQPVAHLLLAAAHAGTLDAAVAATRAARLHPGAVDPTPLALVRALVPPAAPGAEGPGGSEAIVCVGAGVTIVVVHEGGMVRFARILQGGGEGATEALGEELDLGPDQAEGAKRELVGAIAAGARPLIPGVEAIVAPGGALGRRAAALASEIRGTIDFHAVQAGAAELRRVLVTGGGMRTPGLMEALEAQLEVPVEQAHVLDHVPPVLAGFADGRLEAAEELLAVPIGLALRGLGVAPARAGAAGRSPRAISLLPASSAARLRQRSDMMAIGCAAAGVSAVLVGAWVLQGQVLGHQRAVASEAHAAVGALRQQVARYSSVSTLDAKVTAAAATVRSAVPADVDWPRLIGGIAAAMPPGTWMTSFQGQGPNPAGAPSGTSAAQGAGQSGTATFMVNGAVQVAPATWLTDLAKVPALADLWVSSAASGQNGAAVTFSSSADLTPFAHVNRAQSYVAGTAGR